MINAGRIIAPFGGQYYLRPNASLGEPEYFFADTRDEMLKAIRENIHFGALVIKIVVDDQRYIYSADDIKFIVEEARGSGIESRRALHDRTGREKRHSRRVASIEHGFRMSDEALCSQKNDVVLVGTDFTGEAARLSRSARTVAMQFHAIFLDRLKRAYKIGVQMAFGTDTFAEIDGNTRGTIAISFIDSFTEARFPREIF